MDEREESEPRPTIEGFELVGLLGAGGMGVVWEAEQQVPRRRVALKVIRGGQFVDDVQVRLFQREANTLARLEHPDIGAIFEAGRTVDGQHFFAMELVAGTTLDEYLSARVPSGELDPGEVRFRLELLGRIARAVHYAHQRGVIHRDLKPSNLVVGDPDASDSTRDGRPIVKILDFGLARITDADVQASMVSVVGSIKGTLAYMSPEQAGGNSEELDLRTDVYSLGVVLYEMLTGVLPKAFPSGSMLDALRIATQLPPRPIAEAFRGTRALDADVATIVHKALELDPDDRYDSAAALADDVERWLNDQTIQARPPSAVYQLRKLVTRNKVTSAFVVTIALLIAGLAVTMTVLRNAAEAARREAESARADVETVADFQARMLNDVDPETFGRHVFAELRRRLEEALQGDAESEAAIAAVMARLQLVNPTDVALAVLDGEIFSRTEKAIAQELADRPRVRARLELSLGRTAFELGLFERAEGLLQRALDTFTALASPADITEARVALASLHVIAGDWEAGAAGVELALSEGRRTLGAEHPQVLAAMAVQSLLFQEQFLWDEVEAVSTELLELVERVYGPDSDGALEVRGAIAHAWSNQGRLEEAAAEYEQLIPAARARLGSDDLDTLAFLNNAAANYAQMGRYDEALVLYREDLEGSRRVLGSEHYEVGVSLINLSRFHARMGSFEEAEATGREALALAERNAPPRSVTAAMAHATVGDALRGQGRHVEAKPYLENAYQAFVATIGADSGGAKVMAQMLLEGLEAGATEGDLELWRSRAGGD